MWHLARFRKDPVAKVRVPGIGEVCIRVGASDVASIRQVFGAKIYDLSRIPAANARLRAHYRAILDRGRTPVIVDAGANIGAASLSFGRAFPEAVIVALEPEPDNFEMLKRNVERHPSVIPMAAAIGGGSGFVQVEAHGWSARTSRADNGVPILTMADAFANVTDSEPLFAKIDIEGFESDLFRGNVDWLDDVYMVIIEPHDYEHPGKNTSRSFQIAMAARDFDIFVSGDSLIYLRSDTTLNPR
jgi:FkbM family methyltransferase